ncbi:DUF4271 domain-containing protein [Flavobacteriaceae bacterium KMM 6897]|nr:DUF4271 domain-containing protein [Flavobacteriaceae bacterium KMM 6897]MEB8345926.1 DUF4271 domain-containing protein [Flavobacteriaceae bacterium KMM 6898]
MEPTLRLIDTADWITLVLLTSVFFVVIGKSFFYNRFMNFIILPFNNKYVIMYNKKDRLINWFHIFLTLFQLFNFALFVYLARRIVFQLDNSAYPFIYVLILGLLGLFLLIKVLLQLFNAFIFNITSTISELIFKKLTYLNYSGIVMFLANVILTYALKDSKTVIYVSIALVLLINFIGWVTVIRNHQFYITSNIFYFILYLCALEIAPFVIIGSYFKD